MKYIGKSLLVFLFNDKELKIGVKLNFNNCRTNIDIMMNRYYD